MRVIDFIFNISRFEIGILCATATNARFAVRNFFPLTLTRFEASILCRICMKLKRGTPIYVSSESYVKRG